MSEQDDAVRATEPDQQQDQADDRAEDQQPNQQTTDDSTEAEASTEDDQGDTESLDYWKSEAEKWKRAARRAEKINKGEAGRLNEEVSKLRESVANHDSEVIDAAGTLAVERLHTKLARAGVSEQDASALLEHIDPLRLLNDGSPSSKAIDSVASSLTRSLGRSGVDDDQGKRSDGNTFSADDWIRRKAKQK